MSVKGINRPEVCTDAAYKLMKAYKNVAIYAGEEYAGYNFYDEEFGEKELTVSDVSEVCQHFSKLNSDTFMDYSIDISVYD